MPIIFLYIYIVCSFFPVYKNIFMKNFNFAEIIFCYVIEECSMFLFFPLNSKRQFLYKLIGEGKSSEKEVT